MKHMWSEEELQDLIEVQSGSAEIILENIVDSKGRNRFICGNGDTEILEGFQLLYSNWALNGTNLIFEFMGIFNKNISILNKTLCLFTLPEWISNKIKTPMLNLVDHIRYEIIGVEHDEYDMWTVLKGSSDMIIDKLSNTIRFIDNGNPNISAQNALKVRYNIIIDNE